jgi:hypothetical protein
MFRENRSKRFIKKPIANAPIQLTKSVPKGNLIGMDELMHWLET